MELVLLAAVIAICATKIRLIKAMQTYAVVPKMVLKKNATIRVDRQHPYQLKAELTTIFWHILFDKRVYFLRYKVFVCCRINFFALSNQCRIGQCSLVLVTVAF